MNQTIDQGNEEQQLIEKPITLPAAMWKLTKFAALPTASRVSSLSGDTYANFLVTEVSAEAANSVSLISALKRFGWGPIIGGLSFIKVKVGKADTSGRKSEIGVIFRDGQILALVCGGVIAVASLSVYPLLIAIGQDPNIAEEVQAFFIGALPVHWLSFQMIVHQQMALGLKQPWVVFGTSTLNAIATASLSQILVPLRGTRGLGEAASLSAFGTNIGTLCWFYFRQEFRDREFFNRNMAGWQKHIGDILKKGSGLFTQSLSSLLLILGMSIMAGYEGPNALLELLPAQTAYMFFLLLSNMAGQVGAALMARELGDAANNHRITNALTYAKASVILNLVLSSLLATIAITGRDIISNVFIDGTNANDQTIIDQANKALIYAGLMFPIESLSNSLPAALSALSSKKDVSIPAIAGFLGLLTMLPTGAFFYTAGIGIPGIILMKNAGSLIEAGINVSYAISRFGYVVKNQKLDGYKTFIQNAWEKCKCPTRIGTRHTLFAGNIQDEMETNDNIKILNYDSSADTGKKWYNPARWC